MFLYGFNPKLGLAWVKVVFFYINYFSPVGYQQTSHFIFIFIFFLFKSQGDENLLGFQENFLYIYIYIYIYVCKIQKKI